MKSKILHVIGDKRAGGSNIYVKRLVNSHLQEQFEFSVTRLESVKSTLQQFRPDAIAFHYPCAWKYLPSLWWLKQQCQTVIVDHHYCRGFEQHQVKSRSRFRLMLKLAYGLAERVVSVSQAQRQWLLDSNLVSKPKIMVISGAAPMENLLAIPPKVSGKPLIIGAYGRFAPQKGFDLLLQAFKLLDPEQFQLYLGGYGQDEAQINQLARDLPQVKLLGAIADVPAFLASCDVIVIPSRWEPWGLVCLEAKAAGKPIVATAVDGLSEQIRDCGLLVTPNCPEQLAGAIASLPEQPLRQWREVARASVANAWEQFLDSWSDFLEEVTS